jgi:hypothetical protein
MNEEEDIKDELLVEGIPLDLDDAFDLDLNDEGMEPFDEYEDDNDDPSFEDTDGDY